MLDVDIGGYRLEDVSAYRLIRRLGGTILRGVSDWLRHKKRTQDRVEEEYDRGHWQRFAEAGSWQSASSLGELLIPSAGKTMALMEGKVVHVGLPDYYDYRTRKLHHVVSAFTTDAALSADRNLIEVGCGWGRNLFSLRQTGFPYKMRGSDVSASAIQAARSIDERFGTGIEFSVCDLLADDMDAHGHVVLTYYVLEQLNQHTEAVLERICSWAPVRTIHIEPVVELYSLLRPRDVASRVHIKARDYQDHLLSALRKMERQGKVRIVHVERLGCAANPTHEGSCIVWEPI